MRRAVLLVLAGACGRLDFDQASSLTDSATDTSPASLCGVGSTVVLAEGFDASPPWASTYGDTGGGLQFVNSAMQVTPDISAGTIAYWGLIETTPSDYRSRRLRVEVPAMLDTSTLAQALFRISADASNWVQVYQSNAHLVFETRIAGNLSSLDNAYDPVAQRWWQIRDAAGTIHFDVSPDGAAWNELGSFSTPAFVADTQIEIAAGYFTPQTTLVGTARFDNLVVCSP